MRAIGQEDGVATAKVFELGRRRDEATIPGLILVGQDEARIEE